MNEHSGTPKKKSAIETFGLSKQYNAYTRTMRQPWVEHVVSHQKDGTGSLEITVTDEKTAETELLRLLLADKQLVVTAFGRRKIELEEAFIALVKGWCLTFVPPTATKSPDLA